MADIRVTSTGKSFYQIDNGIANLLLEAFPASFERIAPKSATPATTHAHGPRWVVRPNPYSGTPQLLLLKLNEEVAYPGPAMSKPSPEHAAEVFGKMGFPVPPDVLEQYRALLNRANNVANDPDVVNEARRRVENDAYVQANAEAVASRKITG